MDIKFTRMLLGDWFRRLGEEIGLPLSHYSSSGTAYTYGSNNDFHVIAEFTDAPPYLNFTSSDKGEQASVDSLVKQAVGHLQDNNLGGVTWYSTTLSSSDLQVATPNFMGSFLQLLGAQTRVLGWRRLGRDIILQFTEELPEDFEEKKELLAPKSLVHVHIAVSSPCSGHYSSHVAHGVLELVAAICSFALGRGTVLPSTIFPSKESQLEELNSIHMDTSILALARKSVSLDIFSVISAPGGIDVFFLMRSAFLSFDAAVKQQHDAVACILFVVATEAITSPNQLWRTEKLTKRFVEFYEQLMPEALDEIVAHGNFEEVFNITRGQKTAKTLRKKLLHKIYSYRSGHLHEGIQPSYMGLGAGMEMHETVRRGLFFDFCESALIEFLKSPRVSLIGHPAYS